MLRKLASPAWAIFEYGWYPLLFFVATPWFLYRLGTEQFGNWMLLAATVGFSAVLNTGTGAATIKAVSAGIGRSTKSDVERSVRASLAIALVGGTALAILVLVVFWFAGISWLGRMGDPGTIMLTGAAAALLIWVEQVDNVFSSALKGAEQFGQAARVEVASKTLQVLATAIVLLKWPDLMALYAMLLLVALVRLVAKIFVASRLLELSNLRPSLAGAPVILSFAKWGWLQGIGGVLFGVADRILVGSLLGPASLAYYSIASQLALQIHALTAAGVSVIFPMVSRKLEDRGEFSLWRVAKVTMVASTLLSSSLAMMLFLFGPLILHAWIGGSAASGSAQILPWLIAAYCVLALNVVPYYLLLAMGRIRFISLTVLVSGALAMIAMALTIPTFGLIGAPAGRGLYAILSLALAFPLMRHFLKERNAQLQSRLLNTASESELAR